MVGLLIVLDGSEEGFVSVERENEEESWRVDGYKKMRN